MKVDEGHLLQKPALQRQRGRVVAHRVSHSVNQRSIGAHPHFWCRLRPQLACKALAGLGIAETLFSQRVHLGGGSTRSRKRLRIQGLAALTDLLLAPKVRMNHSSTLISKGRRFFGSMSHVGLEEHLIEAG